MDLIDYARDAWRRRDLLRYMSWGDIKAGQRQSLLGVVWIFVQPAAYLLVLSAVFAFFFERVKTDLPYTLFLVVGLVPWLFVSGALLTGVNSVVNKANLIRKVNFPRVYCPIASLTPMLVNLAAGLVIIALVLVAYGRNPGWTVVFVPLVLLVSGMLVFGLALIVAALNAFVRDVASATGLFAQIWFFATPIMYPEDLILSNLKHPLLLGLYHLNPMVEIVEAMRATLLHGQPPRPGFWICAAVSVLLVWVGLLVFRRLERHFADVL